MSGEPSSLRPLPAADRPDLSALEIPHPDPFVCALRIGERNLSRAIPHVSNVEYLQWLDRAAELHADHLGYTRPRLLEEGIMWFVARHEIDYLAEAWPNDELIVATWVRDMGRVKSWRDYVVARPADSTVMCRAATLWVLVNLETRRPTRIHREMVRRFEPMGRPQEQCTSP